MVYKDLQANKRNKKAIQANGESLANVVRETAPAHGKKQRTRFGINSQGQYLYDRNGNYVQKDEPREKVNLADLNEVKEVIIKNGWPKLKKAFNLPDTWAGDNGLDLEKIEAEKWE